MPEDVRLRLERFMRKYNPGKLGTIDGILKAYKGREEQMFEALVRKYGPEPSRDELPDTASAKTAQSSSVLTEETEDVRLRLERFMRKYNPGKLGTIDGILKAYKGREEQMFEALVRKYGPEPSRDELPDTASAKTAQSSSVLTEETEDVRLRLERFMRKYNPGKLGTIDGILKAYKGREEQMFEVLVRKYGPEPSRDEPHLLEQKKPPPSGVKDVKRLHSEGISTRNVIEKVLRVAEVSYEEVLLALWCQKRYLFDAISELPTTASKELRAESFSPSSQATASRERLSRFFTMYAPEKLSGMDALIEAAGAEGMNKLIDSLVAMYGPEPAGDYETEDSRSAGNENTKKRFVSDGGGDNNDCEERQLFANWLVGTGRGAENIFYTLMPEEQLLDFVGATFGDYENRLRRLFVRYSPARLQEVNSLVADHLGHEEELIERLTRELGPEPARSAPTALTRLFSRRRIDADRSHIEEEKWSDNGDTNGGDNDRVNAAEHLPMTLVNGRALIDEYASNESAEFSGDEAAAYPRDEEYWYRLFVHSCEDATNNDDDTDDEYEDNSLRTHCDSAKNDGLSTDCAKTATLSSTTITGEHRSLDSPTTVELRKIRGGKQRIRVMLGNKFGQAIGTLCTACGESIVQSFEALWQPVGPQYLQLFSETVVKDGYLEKLSPDTRRMGVKWQKRYFRVNDKGMHYYETSATSEKPKGYKVFTRNSVIISGVDASTHPNCIDRRYHYFAVTVNESNDVFYLRTPSDEEKRQWVSFLQLALARMRLTTVGHDQNPSRWRARMTGTREANIALIELAQASANVLQSLEQKHNELHERIRSERAQRELMETQMSEMQKQQDFLAQRINEAKAQARLAEEDAEVKCLELAERAASIKQRRLDMKGNLEEARSSIDGITHSVLKLQRDIVDMENECRSREAQLRQVYNKWQRCEERRAYEKGGEYRKFSS
ncbi:hypothetical protein C3747_317g13 [Trypanosoma cruzi]|uniref:PH domain-containing protein n=2 Tax=Trypanosoma cruzi TaxID=5693 RepID=Q4DPC5_TRYCC|nr:hypothetical protein Tc00.1047053508577.70 [Trypanosoma cruzi]EAN94372.1 hypothetical protein Tc00.1047053508577.70 [Trypanosoma cruzi]PWU92551.1 hypothetical protein C3747_317g13 [Trypanosoma cruzi]|eukprot:XP_816223.1 hypothetical protein [Trypanosoma cruzi strain CL Brener]